jgi:toxin YoeB
VKNKKAENKKQGDLASLSWTDHGWDDHLYWQKTDPAIVDRINALIDECLEDPFKGTGKPEPLKNDLTGFWSRRIDREHRLVYLPDSNKITIIQCRFHY